MKHGKKYKETGAKLLGCNLASYYNWSRQNRPIISLLETYFSQEEIEEFLESGMMIKIEQSELNLKIAKLFPLFNDKIIDALQTLCKDPILCHLSPDDVGNEYALSVCSLICRTLIEKSTGTIETRFYFPAFRKSLENIVASQDLFNGGYYDEELDNEAINIEYDYEVAELHRLIINFIKSFDTIVLEYWDLYAEDIRQLWDQYYQSS